MTDMPYPRVGVGVWIRKDGKVLVGKRKGKLGPDTWAPPGGKLDMFEEWEACAHREVAEETGLQIENVQFITATNDTYLEYQQHYITIHVAADWKSGEPVLMEPDKCAEWGWYEWGKLPEPLLLPSRNFVNNGYNPLNL